MRMLVLSVLPLLIPVAANAAQPMQTSGPPAVIALMAPDEVNNLHVSAHSRQEIRLHVPLETFPFLYIASTDGRPLTGTVRARRSTASDYGVRWNLDGKQRRVGYPLGGLTTTGLYGDDLVFFIETGDAPMNAALTFMAYTPEVYKGNLSLGNGKPVSLKYLLDAGTRMRATVPPLGNVTLRSSGAEPLDVTVWYYTPERVRKLGCSGTLQPGIPCTFSAPANADRVYFTVEPNADENATLTASW